MEESVQSNYKDPQVRNGNDDERSAKILEVDTWKPHSFNLQKDYMYRRSADRDLVSSYVNSGRMAPDSRAKHHLSSREVFCLNERIGKGEALRYSENIPQAHPSPSRPGSSGSQRDPLSPTKSEISWAGYSGCLGHHPGYMANTESSRAKIRSQSAPRQRIEFDQYISSKRNVLMGSWDGGLNTEREYPQHTEFQTRAYAEWQRKTDSR